MNDWKPKVTSIDDPIADDYWAYKTDAGEAVSRLTIGRPQPIPDDPNGEWYCPIRIEGKYDDVTCVFGVGPVDALMNAMLSVREFFQQVKEPRPRARPIP